MDQKRCNGVTKTMYLGKKQVEVTHHSMGETREKVKMYMYIFYI